MGEIRVGTAGWTDRTPEGFTFNIKAFSLFTQHPTRVAALPADLRDAAGQAGKERVYLKDVDQGLADQAWDRFLAALEPLRLVGKLGATLLQFPPWFPIGRANKDYILACAQRAAPRRVCVEFRNHAWMTSDNQRETRPPVIPGQAGELLPQPAGRYALEAVDQPGQGHLGREVDQQVDVAGLAVELGQPGSEVRAGIPHEVRGQDEKAVPASAYVPASSGETRRSRNARGSPSGRSSVILPTSARSCSGARSYSSSRWWPPSRPPPRPPRRWA